jgi:dihydrofolate reductase
MSIEPVAIVAVARNGVIGAAKGMPWRLSSDMKRFKALTMGKPLIVGRRTYESFRRPLPGRRLIVVTRAPAFFAPDAILAADPKLALALARQAAEDMGAREIMIGGGAEIYGALLAETRRIELTEVALEPEGDTVFPPLDSSQWREVARETPPRGPKDEADFAWVTLVRRA